MYSAKYPAGRIIHESESQFLAGSHTVNLLSVVLRAWSCLKDQEHWATTSLHHSPCQLYINPFGTFGQIRTPPQATRWGMGKGFPIPFAFTNTNYARRTFKSWRHTTDFQADFIWPGNDLRRASFPPTQPAVTASLTLRKCRTGRNEKLRIYEAENVTCWWGSVLWAGFRRDVWIMWADD